MKKVIRNGEVAVAFSPGFGAGWTTWNDEISPFEPKVIEMIEEGNREKITPQWCQKNLGVDAYCGGANDLEIIWIPEGTKFYIHEYDGSESIVSGENLYLIA